MIGWACILYQEADPLLHPRDELSLDPQIRFPSVGGMLAHWKISDQALVAYLMSSNASIATVSACLGSIRF